MSKSESIELGKKALKDIGHWEEFNIENARFMLPDSPYNYYHWYVWFNFTNDDWFKGEKTPTVIVNDKEKLVTFVSWDRAEFLLNYDEAKDKYWHPTLSR